MSTSDDPKYPAPYPEEEIDIPPKNVVPPTRDLPAEKTVEIEKKVQYIKNIQPILMQNKGFALLCACLAAVLFLYLVDTIVINLGMKSSEMLGDIADLGKTIITLLLGYVFATEKHQK